MDLRDLINENLDHGIAYTNITVVFFTLNYIANFIFFASFWMIALTKPTTVNQEWEAAQNHK